MKNLEEYNKIFAEVLSITADNLASNPKRSETEKWDSLAHITLISELEDKFEIMFDPSDILAFNSYEVGKEILKKYDIVM